MQAGRRYGGATAKPRGARVDRQGQRAHRGRTRVPKPNRARQLDDQSPSARLEFGVRKIGRDDLQGQALGDFDRHS